MKNFNKITFLVILTFSLAQIFAQKNKPEMIKVEGGSFEMGSEDGYDDEKPIHTVVLSDFYISKHEVTVAQYKEYCNATGKKFPNKPNSQWYVEHDNAEKWEWKNNHPVVNITWFDAVGYTEWLSEKTGENYSLPTEAQWEYAARGGNKSKGYTYAGSNNLNEVAWYDETTYERGTRPVGTLKPNELGIYDMSGNAMEWCLDGYEKYSKRKQRDPQGGDSPTLKVIRGGSWFYVDEFCRTTQRDCPKVSNTKFDYGFRVVKNTK